MIQESLRYWTKGSLLLVLTVLGACRQMTLDETPSDLYDRGKDTEAFQSAKSWLGTKYDVGVRLFIVQYNLARFLETGEHRYAAEIKRYYQGADSLDWKSIRWNLNHDDFISEAKYFDAAILLFANQDRRSALKLLDSYCPIPDYEQKVRCHVKNYAYFERNARTGIDRNKQEIAFIADLTVGVAYQDYKMIGHAIELLAEYDIKHATERAMTYAAIRNADNDEVMQRFCSVPQRYFRYDPDTEKRAEYLAAYERANCKRYLASNQAQALSDVQP